MRRASCSRSSAHAWMKAGCPMGVPSTTKPRSCGGLSLRHTSGPRWATSGGAGTLDQLNFRVVLAQWTSRISVVFCRDWSVLHARGARLSGRRRHPRLRKKTSSSAWKRAWAASIARHVDRWHTAPERGAPLLAAFSLMHLSPLPRVLPQKNIWTCAHRKGGPRGAGVGRHLAKPSGTTRETSCRMPPGHRGRQQHQESAQGHAELGG